MRSVPSRLLARAWDEAAPGYERYFVPRFAPSVATAVGALDEGDLPPGPVLVPCCGTFPELPALVRRHPRREIVGIDLSAGMARLARERAGGGHLRAFAIARERRRCASYVSSSSHWRRREPGVTGRGHAGSSCAGSAACLTERSSAVTSARRPPPDGVHR